MNIRSLILVVTILLATPVRAETPIPDPGLPEAKVYAEQCSSCHALPHPKRLYAGQWKHMLNVMYMRISERNKEPLSDEEQQAILKYLESHAR
ncbi:MAG: hypothetical protein ACE5DY_08825 [Mariprofundaceae bacterium]